MILFRKARVRRKRVGYIIWANVALQPWGWKQGYKPENSEKSTTTRCNNPRKELIWAINHSENPKSVMTLGMWHIILRSFGWTYCLPLQKVNFLLWRRNCSSTPKITAAGPPILLHLPITLRNCTTENTYHIKFTSRKTTTTTLICANFEGDLKY